MLAVSDYVGLTSHPTHNLSFWGTILQATWPKQQCRRAEGQWSVEIYRINLVAYLTRHFCWLKMSDGTDVSTILCVRI